MSKENDLQTTATNAAGYSPISPLFRVCDGERFGLLTTRRTWQ